MQMNKSAALGCKLVPSGSAVPSVKSRKAIVQFVHQGTVL